MTILLKLDHIVKHYMMGDTLVKALDDVSLTINNGEFVAIMGQSGSGKSTMMNIIGCLDRPTSGDYFIHDRDVAQVETDELSSLRRETFGFVFQRYNLLATSTALENVEIPAVYAGIKKTERRRRAAELLKQLGLEERMNNRPSQLSGGQQQRVAIARALMNNPPVILADEPTGALDTVTGEEVMNLLKELHASGHTVILITHDEDVAKHAKRIIRLKDGRIVDDKTIEEDIVPSGKMPGKLTSQTLLQEIAESVKMAISALHVNIFRTALTLLGIIIGVAAVITMLAVGNGSKQKVLDQINAMGSDTLSIRPGIAGFRGSGDIVTLIPDDADAILQLPNVSHVLPERDGHQTIRFGNKDYATSVNGMGPSLPIIRDWPVANGNFYGDQDLKSYAPVAVMGQTVVDQLFGPDSDPIGQTILIKNIPFQVIGVMSKKGASGWGQDQDDVVFIPVTTAMVRLFGQNYLNGITIEVSDANKMDDVQQAVTDLLTDRHRKEDFSVRNMASLIDMATQTQDTLTYLLGTVAAISLLVGGIGVMNIMLVSVTERTREIGIRMATGARMRNILVQFNTEATIVCVIGGLIGTVLGFFVGWILTLFGMSVVFSAFPSILAFSCAFLTGLIFGYLPARQAARLDPVIALSSE
jgi:macrolide transport system ATP-binding/permease protein